MSQAGGVFGTRVVAGLRAADEGLDCAVHAPVWQCADADVETGLELLDRLDARSAALRSALLTQAEARGLKERTGAPSTERWLADRFRWSRPQATRRLAAARAHARQPVLHAALAAGAVTTEQASVVAAGLDAIDRVPGVSDAERAQAAGLLVGQARELDPRGLEATGRAIVETLTRLPSGDDPADAAALAREAERAEREAQERERTRFRLTRRSGRARAVIELGSLGEAVAREWARTAGKPQAGCDGFEDTRQTAERLGDALVELLAAATAGTSGERDVERGGERDVEERPCRGHRGPISPVALLTVTVTLAELRAGLTGAGTLDTGQPVSAATLRQLACDALVVPAVLGGRSEVLDLGRSRRLFTRAQRRATILRDRGCAAPGCDRPPQACQVHHRRAWDHGGPTDKDNAVLLCGYHHRMVHRQGWAVRLAANGYPELIPPTTIDPGQRPRQHVRYRLLAAARLRR